MSAAAAAVASARDAPCCRAASLSCTCRLSTSVLCCSASKRSSRCRQLNFSCLQAGRVVLSGLLSLVRCLRATLFPWPDSAVIRDQVYSGSVSATRVCSPLISCAAASALPPAGPPFLPSRRPASGRITQPVTNCVIINHIWSTKTSHDCTFLREWLTSICVPSAAAAPAGTSACSSASVGPSTGIVAPAGAAATDTSELAASVLSDPSACS